MPEKYGYGLKAAKKLGIPLKEVKKLKPKKRGNLSKYAKGEYE